LKAVSRQLEDLLSNYLSSEQAKNEIRQIGEKLNEAGGMSLMRKVGYDIQNRDLLKASWLNNAWDGIGYWMS